MCINNLCWISQHIQSIYIFWWDGKMESLIFVWKFHVQNGGRKMCCCAWNNWINIWMKTFLTVVDFNRGIVAWINGCWFFIFVWFILECDALSTRSVALLMTMTVMMTFHQTHLDSSCDLIIDALDGVGFSFFESNY